MNALTSPTEKSSYRTQAKQGDPGGWIGVSGMFMPTNPRMDAIRTLPPALIPHLGWASRAQHTSWRSTYFAGGRG